MSTPPSHVYRFAGYRLDAGRRILERGGQIVALAPKTFDLLLLLVRRGDHAVPKRELLASLWPDTFVEDASLSFQISALRKALGSDGAALIETLPKHGYRRRRRGLRGVGPSLFATADVASAPVVMPLTTYPGMQSTPSLSPDGSQVAFAWNGPAEDDDDIYVKVVGPANLYASPPIRRTTFNRPGHPTADRWRFSDRMAVCARRCSFCRRWAGRSGS